MKRVGKLTDKTVTMIEEQAESMASGVIQSVSLYSVVPSIMIEGEKLLHISIHPDPSGFCREDPLVTTVVLITTNRAWTTRVTIPEDGPVTLRPKIFLRG